MNAARDKMWEDLWWGLGHQTNLGWVRRALRELGYEISESDGMFPTPNHLKSAVFDAAHRVCDLSAQAMSEVLGMFWDAIEARGWRLAQVAPKDADPLAAMVMEDTLMWTPSANLALDVDYHPDPPGYAHPGDVGLDLATQEPMECKPHQVTYIPLGMRVKLPLGTWGWITGRSSSMMRRGIWVVSGVIDNGYTGPLFAGVVPVGTDTVTVERGAKIAQMILLPIMHPAGIVKVQDLPETARGDNGFGSTGS